MHSPATSRAQPVSVVVPVHNGAQTLATTLQAVAAQSHQAAEVIVVDDGSTDGSAELAKATAQSGGLVLRLIQQRQAGVSAARNAGWAAAQGEFVCFLDQDDIWHPQHLQRQLQVFSQNPTVDVVVSPYQHWYPTHPGQADPALIWPPEQALQLDAAHSGWVYHAFLRDCWALTSATLLRRSLLAPTGGFDASLPFSEDWDLWLRLARDHQFAHLNWPPVLYRQHPVQGSRKVRTTDYRCELLQRHAASHGLASRDGRALTAQEFNQLLARYQMAFGYHHLQQGDRALGVRNLWQAWRRQPLAPRALALALAGSVGWRPRGTQQAWRQNSVATD